jgi:hypothetical protein
MPALTVQQASERYNMMVDFTKTVMLENQDFGKIPGVAKACLYKAGAEKLCTLFGFTPTFQLIERTEDWTGRDHGEPFFYYFYKCILVRDGMPVGEGDGSCNSWEKKYRYREGKRICPKCGVDAIIAGKPEYGGGFICFAKKGGCGAKFGSKDESITKQEVGAVPNPDIAEVVNTIQKMAQKRALIAAVLIACNASAFYTQDVDDMRVIDVDYEEVHETQDEVRERRLAEERSRPQRQARTHNLTAEELDPEGPPSDPLPPRPIAVLEKREAEKHGEAEAASKGTRKPREKQPPPPVSFEMLEAFKEVKGLLNKESGADALYYEVLGGFGYKKSNEIPDRDSGSAVYKCLVAALNKLKRIRMDREEMLDLVRGMNADKFWAFAGSEGIDEPALENLTGDALSNFLMKLREFAKQ